jgi:hypothetical protein
VLVDGVSSYTWPTAFSALRDAFGPLRRHLPGRLGEPVDPAWGEPRHRRATADAIELPRVAGTWTAWRTAAADVSGSVHGRTAVRPRRAVGWPCWPNTNHPHARLEMAVVSESSAPGPCFQPSARHRGHDRGVCAARPRVRCIGRGAILDGHRPRRPTVADTSTAADTSLAPCARHQPSGRWSCSWSGWPARHRVGRTCGESPVLSAARRRDARPDDRRRARAA